MTSLFAIGLLVCSTWASAASHHLSASQRTHNHVRAQHALQAHARKLQQSVAWNMSQCSWPSGGWPPRCQPTHAAMLQAGAMPNWRYYGARATGFITAANALCSLFSEKDCNFPDSPEKAWPCAWNGEACALDGKLFYGVWECPGHEARQESSCNWAPHQASKPMCMSLTNCSWIPSTMKTPATCEATFFSKLSSGDQ